MTVKELARMIDISAVRAESTLDEVRQCADFALKYDCVCVFALPAHTPELISYLNGSKTISAGGVVSFPGGAERTVVKELTTRDLRTMGCGEIDMVNNIAWLKAGRKADYVADVRAVREAAEGLPLKVILECHYLTDAEICRACEWCVEAGASFVKTGTGWAPTGATLERVKLMKSVVGDACKVKAAGGVRDLATVEAMLEAGVSRFGIGVRTAGKIFDEMVARGGK